MYKELIFKLKSLPKLKLIILLLTVWQYVSVAGMAVLGWPVSLVWLNLGLLLAFLLLCPTYESLLLLVLSIPFSVAVPNKTFDGLPMWRILYIALFAIWLVRDRKFKFSGITFLPWDKYLAGLWGVGIALAVLFGQFKIEGIKQGIFFLNIYAFYIVLINTIKSKQQFFEIIRYVIWALAIIITLGFTQLIGTFVTNLETFWVYWASNVSKLYYGSSFSSVALYSNSWFSFAGGRELRMFSIMPDSQSFAYICLIALCMGTALTRSVFVHVKKWLWSGIRFGGLGLILSGTRAAWVGMLAPFFFVAAAYIKKFQTHLAKKFFWPFMIIFILFGISPLINRGLSLMRVEKFQENFLLRAASIYNLNETSNRGRIEMWKNSARFALVHPWGIGFGNFLVSFSPNSGAQSYGELANAINERYNLPARYVSAHSLYFQIAVETGIVGIVLFVMFWVAVIRYLWEFVKRHKHVEDFFVYFVAQALLMIVWILAAAVFDITLLNDKVLMFFLINLGLAGLIVKKYHEYED